MSLDKIKDALPKVQFNKNGYEIRTEVLEMAKHFTEFEYSNKWNGWEITSKRDPQTGEIVNKIGMPEIPGTKEVLETAEEFYKFVTGTSKQNSNAHDNSFLTAG